jgi:hypothetical protein
MAMAADRGIVLAVDTLELVERIRAARLYALKHTVSSAPVDPSQTAIIVALCLKDGDVHREENHFELGGFQPIALPVSLKVAKSIELAAGPFALHRRYC